jgi:hypothetical protein
MPQNISGTLSHNEFVEMSEAIQEAGGGFFDGNFSQLLEKFDANGGGFNALFKLIGGQIIG